MRDEHSMVVAVLPAHDEEMHIAKALEALSTQTHPPDYTIVISDNSTDATEEICETAGAMVFLSKDNLHKKAGAINQLLEILLPSLIDEDALLVVDADSYLDCTFIEEALRLLHQGYGAVGGTFRGRSGGGYVGWLQRNEFARYGRDVRRQKGKTLVLTGTATLFRGAALKAVARLRPSRNVYDTSVLTEDFELTLALKHAGQKVLAPKGCTLTTEVMPSWRALGRQRLRWKRGALESLLSYGLTRITFAHWARQIATALGIGVMATYLGAMAYGLASAHTLTLYPLWIAVSMIFAIERAITVYKRGLRHALLATLLIFEIPFDIFLQAVHVIAYTQALTRAERRW